MHFVYMYAYNIAIYV